MVSVNGTDSFLDGPGKREIRTTEIREAAGFSERNQRKFELTCNDLATDLEMRTNGSSQVLDLKRRKWSRGRELNSRPADYEMNGFLLSLLFSAPGTLHDSPPFAIFRRSAVQRNVQRILLFLRIET
jgi:hypothetical protein